MLQTLFLPLHTIQEEPLPGHLKNKIVMITFSLKPSFNWFLLEHLRILFDKQTIECNIVLGLIGKLNKVGWSYIFSFYVPKNLTCNMKLVWGSTAALMYGICGIEIPVVFPLLKVVWPEYITLIRLIP